MAPIITNGCFEAWDDAHTPTGWTPVVTAGAGETSSIHAGAGVDPIEDLNKNYEGQMRAPVTQEVEAVTNDLHWTGYGSMRAGTHPSTKSLDIACDELGTDVHIHQHLTLEPLTDYHLQLRYRMGYDLNEEGDEEQVLGSSAPQLKLIEDGNGHSLLVDGTWQANANGVIALPAPKADEWKRLSIRFTTPATHTAYTLEIDSNNMQGTEYVSAAPGPQVVGYEHLYVDAIRLDKLEEETPIG